MVHSITQFCLGVHIYAAFSQTTSSNNNNMSQPSTPKNLSKRRVLARKGTGSLKRSREEDVPTVTVTPNSSDNEDSQMPDTQEYVDNLPDEQTMCDDGPEETLVEEKEPETPTHKRKRYRPASEHHLSAEAMKHVNYAAKLRNVKLAVTRFTATKQNSDLITAQIYHKVSLGPITIKLPPLRVPFDPHPKYNTVTIRLPSAIKKVFQKVEKTAYETLVLPMLKTDKRFETLVTAPRLENGKQSEQPTLTSMFGLDDMHHEVMYSMKPLLYSQQPAIIHIPDSSDDEDKQTQEECDDEGDVGGEAFMNLRVPNPSKSQVMQNRNGLAVYDLREVKYNVDHVPNPINYNPFKHFQKDDVLMPMCTFRGISINIETKRVSFRWDVTEVVYPNLEYLRAWNYHHGRFAYLFANLDNEVEGGSNDAANFNARSSFFSN